MRLLSLTFGVDLIAFLAQLLAYFDGVDLLGLFFSLEALLDSFSFLNGLLTSPARVLLGLWANFFDFSFSISEMLLSSDSFCLFGIYILSNVGFSSKFRREVVVLEIISS